MMNLKYDLKLLGFKIVNTKQVTFQFFRLGHENHMMNRKMLVKRLILYE